MPIDVWDPARGGAERYLHRLARELCARGHDVAVLCLEAKEAGGAGACPRIEVLRAPRFPRWLREASFAREAVRAHRRAGRDVLFAVRHALEADVYQPHGGPLPAARAAAGQCLSPLRRLARDLLAWVRPSLRVLLWLDGEVFRRSPRVITVTVSEKVERDFRAAYTGVPFRFERLHNPVDLEQFHGRDRAECALRLRSRLGIPAETPVALFAAHRFRQKGLLHAMEALWRAAAWHLVVFGRDQPRPFARVAARAGIASRVHFAGVEREMRKMYAGADALLLPTYYDPCSLAVLEAMACGTPPITTRANGASDLIEHERNGFIVESPTDVEGLADALERVRAGGEPLRAAAARAAALLGWKPHVDRLEKILSVAGGRN